MKTIPCIITTDKKGVFMGYVKPEDVDKNVLQASEVRMCVYWSAEVRGVLGLAAVGPDKKSRITKASPKANISGITAVFQITSKAEKAWLKEPWG